MAFGIQISAEFRGATESRGAGFLVGELSGNKRLTPRRRFISYDYAAKDAFRAAVDSYLEAWNGCLSVDDSVRAFDAKIKGHTYRMYHVI